MGIRALSLPILELLPPAKIMPLNSVIGHSVVNLVFKNWIRLSL